MKSSLLQIYQWSSSYETSTENFISTDVNKAKGLMSKIVLEYQLMASTADEQKPNFEQHSSDWHLVSNFIPTLDTGRFSSHQREFT